MARILRKTPREPRNKGKASRSRQNPSRGARRKVGKFGMNRRGGDPMAECPICYTEYPIISEGTLIHSIEPRGSVPHTACSQCLSRLLYDRRPCPHCRQPIIRPTHREEKEYLNELATLHNTGRVFYSAGELAYIDDKLRSIERRGTVNPRYSPLQDTIKRAQRVHDRYELSRGNYIQTPQYASNLIPVEYDHHLILQDAMNRIGQVEEEERVEYLYPIPRRQSICSRMSGCTIQ